MTIKSLSLVLLLVVSLGSACKSNAPAPEPAADAAPVQKAPEPVPNPHEPGGLTPEQQAMVDKIPRPEPDSEGNIDLGAMTMHVPDGWSFVKPKALVRRAQFDVPGSNGNAETIVYFFGKAGAGSVNVNIDRWIRQFSKDDGTEVVDVTPRERTISGFKVTDLDVAGNYDGGMTPSGLPGDPKPDQRLLAAIVFTPDGPYYIKLLGPNKTVSANKKAFEGMLKSMKPKKP